MLKTQTSKEREPTPEMARVKYYQQRDSIDAVVDQPATRISTGSENYPSPDS